MTMKIDKEWFLGKLADNRKSLRGLARALEIDPSAASRMLSGDRKMKMDEAGAIALFLNAPVSEVLRHAGVEMYSEGLPSRILLAAIITSAGTIERLKEAKPLPQSVIDRAQAAITLHGTGKIIAAQIRAETGPLAMFDDAVVLFTATDAVENDAIGALAVCRTYDGEQIVAKIDRARKTGEARIVTINGKSREITLQTASPILAIIP